MNAKAVRHYTIKYRAAQAFFLAGQEGLEPTTRGFGDRYSAN